MGIRAADTDDLLAAILYGEPVGQQPRGVSGQFLPTQGGRRTGVGQLHGVEGEGRAVKAVAGGAIEAEPRQRVVLRVGVAGMVQDHDLGAFEADVCHELNPIGFQVVGYGAAGRHGKSVEVAILGGDFVAGDGGEERVQPQPGLVGFVVRVMVVVGGDGHFHALTGQRHHAFLDRRVAVAAESDGVNVRIGGNESGGVHLPTKTQVHRGGAVGQRNPLAGQAPFHTAGRGEFITSRRELEGGFVPHAVNPSGANSGIGVGQGEDVR